MRVAQAAGLPLLFIPITLAAYVGLPTEKSNNAAGLINFMRNIGGSIGTSLVTTLIARRAQFHQVHLVSHLASDNPAFQAQMNGVARQLVVAGLGTPQAVRQAYARWYQLVLGQAQTLAYIDTFWLLALCGMVMVGLSFVLKKNDPRTGGGVPAH
jgi:DHA2 family multidrug resistance protein